MKPTTLWEAKHAAINVWSLGQLWASFRSSDHQSFGIISAWRSDRPVRENHEADEKLRSGIADYVLLLGVSQETGLNGGLRVLREPAYWLNGIAFDRARDLAEKFDQPLFVWCGPETQGTVCLYDRSGSIVERWSQFDPEALADAYRRRTGRAFYFEADEQNFIGGMGRQSFVRDYVGRLIDCEP